MHRQSPPPGILPSSAQSPTRVNSRKLSLGSLTAAAASYRPHRRSVILAAILLVSLTAFSSLPEHETPGLEPNYHALAELALNISLPPLLNPDTPAVEIWARGPHNRIFSSSHSQRVRNLLTPSQLDELRGICGRCLYHSLQTAISVQGTPPTRVYVSTGDIDDQWLRDSAVQLAIYLPRVTSHPILKPVLATAITTSAYYILSDPYANAFTRHWRSADQLGKWHRIRGRGGWVGERKYELDSGAYFLNLLWNYHHSPGLTQVPQYSPLFEPTVKDAVLLMLKVWSIERYHEELSPYRFVELPREGKGAPVAYTGMVWSAFRPSDDGSTYGYNIPGNMYAAAALTRLLQLNRKLWKNPDIKTLAKDLLSTIKSGLNRYAVVLSPGGQKVYAYEVDGLGNAVVDFDDPNLPSLLSVPLLGYEGFDPDVYHNTRERIWSSANPYYYRGGVLEGMGSPHTPDMYIWPLAHMVKALTGTVPVEQAKLIGALLQMQCGDGLMHESVHASTVRKCTRPHFEWANAMLVVTLEQILGWDCEVAGQEEFMRGVERRERAKGRKWWGWWVTQKGFDPLLYERLEDAVMHV